MRISRRSMLGATLAGLVLPGCNRASGGDNLRIGVAFETLQTEYWVASLEAFRDELAKRGLTMLEAVADGDSNRQLEQVSGFLARSVDGLIVVPKDASSAVSIVKAANRADVPLAFYNRPPAENEGRYVAVVADNFELSKQTVSYLCEQARKAGGQYKAMILTGDLADQNAIGRRDGFRAAVEPHSDIIKVVAEVPTDWNQEIALAGATNALHADPDINFIFTSSDFLFPSLQSALQAAGKYHKVGEPGHVLLAGFDGDQTAYQMLIDGYLDADGVQDVYFECEACINAILDLRAGKQVDKVILDKGFVVHRDNLAEVRDQMWGAQVATEA